MFSNTPYKLLMSEIYLSLNDTNSVSPDLLTQYKTMVEDMGEYKPEDTRSYLLNIVDSYVDTASKVMPKETLLQYCNTILNTVNTIFTGINVCFYLKRFEYRLCDQLTTMTDKVAILKDYIAESANENLDERIECRSNLLDIYLSNPTEYLEDIRQLSGELKTLLAMR